MKIDLFHNVEVMAEREYLGEFEHKILLALLRLEEKAYGVTVRQEIESRTRREVSVGAVYATLDRLEQKGFVRSYLGDPTPERGGRAKRFVQVTREGRASLASAQAAYRSLMEGLNLLPAVPASRFALRAGLMLRGVYA